MHITAIGEIGMGVSGKVIHPTSLVRPACSYSKGCKSLTCPYSGKRPATDKGVHREVESEGSLR